MSSTFLEINETFINENDPGYGTTETIEGLVNQSVETGTFNQTQDSTADVIVVNSTAGLEVDNMIIFDTTTSNIVAGTIYFIKTVNAVANQITISATAGGIVFDLGDSVTGGNWCAGVETIGVTSGASVPEILVRDLLAWLAERGFGSVEEVTATQESLLFALPPELRKDLKTAGK